MAKRYTRKELKQPDQFQSFWSRVYDFLKDTKRPLVIATLVAVAVIVGVSVYMRVTERAQQRSSRALDDAVRILNAELKPQLQDPAAPQEDDPDVPRFKTARERAEAGRAAIDKVVVTYFEDPVGPTALLARASLSYEQGLPKDAIKDYQKFLEVRGTGNLAALAYEGLGYCHEAEKDLDKALEAFRKMAAKDDDFSRDRALFHQARVLAKQGKTDEAKKLYEEILQKHPETPLRDDVNNRMALLSG